MENKKVDYERMLCGNNSPTFADCSKMPEFHKAAIAFLDLLCFSKVRHATIGLHIRRIPLEKLCSRPSFGIMSLYL